MLIFPGIIGQISQKLYEFLLQLQVQMNKVIKSVGKIDHSLYPFLINKAKVNFLVLFAS